MTVLLGLERVITGKFEEGRERFGDLGLDLKPYVDRVQSIVQKNLGLSPASDAVVVFVRALHGRDLYLGTACAQESVCLSRSSAHRPTTDSYLAWKTFEHEYKAFIYDLARFFSRQEFLSRDLADNMLADLFFPDRSGSSRIASYDGRSSLCTWLRVVFSNRSINAKRSRAYSQSQEVDADIPDRPALLNIDRVMYAGRYGLRLADSVATACRKLATEERLLLLWRYEDGLQLKQIAELLEIHPSNVSRRLDRIHAKLREQVVANLLDKHRMSQAAIRECLQDVVENANHGISILDSIRVCGSAAVQEIGV
jgi:RNA polymerase sigma factor (sigma-70 family)